MAIFQDKPISWYLNATILDFFGARMIKVMVTTGAIRRPRWW